MRLPGSFLLHHFDVVLLSFICPWSTQFWIHSQWFLTWFFIFLYWFWTRAIVLERNFGGYILRVHSSWTAPVPPTPIGHLGSIILKVGKIPPNFSCHYQTVNFLVNICLLALLWYSCLLFCRHKYHTGLEAVASLSPLTCIWLFWYEDFEKCQSYSDTTTTISPEFSLISFFYFYF